MSEEPLSPQQQETEAIRRLGTTYDGFLLHRYLRRILESCRADNEHGALQRHEGARILARDLMAIMAPAIEANSGGRTERSEPILPGGTGRIAVGGSSGGRKPGARRVALEPGDGWDSGEPRQRHRLNVLSTSRKHTGMRRPARPRTRSRNS
jgi:hypothetical protein